MSFYGAPDRVFRQQKAMMDTRMLSYGSAMIDAMDGVAYIVDRNLQITALGQPNWDRFARENDAADLSGAGMLG